VRAARDTLSSAALRRLQEARERGGADGADGARAAESREARRDALELSAAARAHDAPSAAEREARGRELAEAHQMQRLHTPERIARAAQRLLEGS
jgi:hypothetical protein